jgi:hypothetical protein
MLNIQAASIIDGTEVSSNAASLHGGAISIIFTADVKISRSTISNNRALGAAGVLFTTQIGDEGSQDGVCKRVGEDFGGGAFVLADSAVWGNVGESTGAVTVTCIYVCICIYIYSTYIHTYTLYTSHTCMCMHV